MQCAPAGAARASARDSLLERKVDGLLHEEVSVADIPLVQHGVRLDGGHARGVLDLQSGRAVNCRMQQHMQGS